MTQNWHWAWSWNPNHIYMRGWGIIILLVPMLICTVAAIRTQRRNK